MSWETILKLDWREMLDSYITEDSLFQNIYKHLTDSLDYNAPSKDEVIDYLEETEVEEIIIKRKYKKRSVSILR